MGKGKLTFLLRADAIWIPPITLYRLAPKPRALAANIVENRNHRGASNHVGRAASKSSAGMGDFSSQTIWMGRLDS